MNKYTPVPYLLLVAFLYAGCSTSKTVFDVPQQVVGEIMVVGNEPFTKLVVRVEGGGTYLINCSEEIKKSLLSHQGKIAEVFYDEIEKKNSDVEIKVIKVNFLLPKGSQLEQAPDGTK